MADPQLDLASSSKWHSLRPWNHRLSLSVLEITSVSATFVLSSLSSQTNLSLLLDGEDYDGAESATPRPARAHQIISDALSKGLSVKVNGTPWQRVLIRIDDETDEAVIIIYGLMPGRQYDIELGIIPGEERVKGHIVTVEATRDADGALDALGRSLPGADPSPSPPSPSPPSTPPTPPLSHPAVEDYLASLQTTLAHLQAEHEALLGSLKSARRDAQKSQAALRAEIASLKRASAKHGAGDVRMRQKVRALEEAVKQAVKGREDVEAECGATEAECAAHHAVRGAREEEHGKVAREAEEARRARVRADEAADAVLQCVRAELAGVEARLDKLHAKREKLEGRSASEGESDASAASSRGVVGALEDRVRALRLERERIEADPYAYAVAAAASEESSASDKGSPSPTTRVDAANPNHAPASTSTSTSAHAHHGRPHHAHPLAPRGKRFPPFAPHAHARAHNPFVVQNPRQQQQPAAPPRAHFGGRRPHPARRRTASPPASASGSSSTLSSLAPPFEPAAGRGAAGEGFKHGRAATMGGR